MYPTVSYLLTSCIFQDCDVINSNMVECLCCAAVLHSVCGLIVPQEDLPFNDLGMCPDVVSD